MGHEQRRWVCGSGGPADGRTGATAPLLLCWSVPRDVAGMLAFLTQPQGCEALSLMFCPIFDFPPRAECPEVSVPAALRPSGKGGEELLLVPPCFCNPAVAPSEAGICGELIGPTRKRQAKFQSSARTAGFHLNGAFWFFSNLILVFCVAVSGS